MQLLPKRSQWVGFTVVLMTIANLAAVIRYVHECPLTTTTTTNASSSIPKHIRLMIVGDSLSRYQYLSLVYFLKHGEFEYPFETPDTPSLRMQDIRNFDGWADQVRKTTEMLSPFELCDCWPYRQHEFEARYFYDDEYDNFVHFAPRFGDIVSQGHYAPEDFPHFHGIHQNTMKKKGNGNTTMYDRSKTINFTTTSLNSASIDFWKKPWTLEWRNLGSYIMRFQPEYRPTHIIINSGLWDTDHAIRDPEEQDAMIQNLRSVPNLTIIYRTTTAIKPKQQIRQKSATATSMEDFPTLLLHDERLCREFDHCFDMRWTTRIRKFLFATSLFFVVVYDELILRFIISSIHPPFRSISSCRDSTTVLPGRLASFSRTHLSLD